MALLHAAAGLLSERRGQTGLSIELAIKEGVSLSMVVCKMLDEKTGKALSKEDAIRYSIIHKIPFVEGKDFDAD